MKRSTPIKYTANTSRYNIRSKSDKPSGRKDTGGFFFYTYLRSADFLPRLFALTKQLRLALYLPVAATTSGGRLQPFAVPAAYTPCERPALQGFTSSALLHNTIALPIPNAENSVFLHKK